MIAIILCLAKKLSIILNWWRWQKQYERQEGEHFWGSTLGMILSLSCFDLINTTTWCFGFAALLPLTVIKKPERTRSKCGGTDPGIMEDASMKYYHYDLSTCIVNSCAQGTMVARKQTKPNKQKQNNKTNGCGWFTTMLKCAIVEQK